MSIQRGFGLNGAKLFTNVVTPQDIHLQFTVDSANVDGYGVTTAIKSNGYVESVFMHTSQTPGSIRGKLNPNPPVGFALITLKNNMNTFLGLSAVQIPPLASTSTTSLTANHVYAITAVGTSTTAQWDGYGLPPGFAPAVGAAFVCTNSGTLANGSTVGLPQAPVALTATVVGDPNATISNANLAGNAGAQILVQLTAPLAVDGYLSGPVNPADGTVIDMLLSFDRSSVTIDGL